MHKRHRLEDMGRIAERLHQILDTDLFDHLSRWKGFESFYEHCREEEKCEDLYSQIDRLHDHLHEIYEIARWGEDDDDDMPENLGGGTW